ncbi:type IV toxin-antitoxin system AbiEi family antitoxin domain-containing protein [Curtobacterium herbarum]|uniref:AbiEi antitoxin N-terminal domain-containing protein n=1 Tax=Curtobacterium herbarum TaxID=150122 RepID=A0ABP4K4U2_9MICO|nr:type IV toxin-antitoxin system AbiEi family antitoxin domain-containing protein [Curtobacterium herbarum]MBM7476819.1 putative transcriptional regulator of viral defense system [Curtobacterium herbarum]MCS6545168.1 type IV toxin-antitoxin system AbiEi family antitoxin domain-containing protein [Curtobacterium herbarum]
MAGAVTGRLAEVATQRWGLVTTAQAAAVDVGRNALTRLTSTGVLVRVAQGVYRMAGAPELEHEAIYATWLALGGATRPATGADVPAVVAAGVTATVLHNIGDFSLEQSDFIVPTRRATRLPARLRVRALTSAEVTFAESVPTLTVERTIADLVGLSTDRSLVVDTLASAHEQGKFSRPRQLAQYLDPLARGSGFRDGSEFAADLLARASIDRPITDA